MVEKVEDCIIWKMGFNISENDKLIWYKKILRKRKGNKFGFDIKDWGIHIFPSKNIISFFI